MATVLVKDTAVVETLEVTETTKLLGPRRPSLSESNVPPLGAAVEQRRSWFRRAAAFDDDAIATQASVYDDPDTAEKYLPRPDWENIHRFDPLERWTWREENRLVRKIDIRIMIWACIMFMALEMDRANIRQALTDNFLGDLELSTNDYNLGNSLFKLAFLCAELPSQLVSKWVGPDRWIPTQMVFWSLVASWQFWLSGRTSFLVCRVLLGALQGGFIPEVVLYLSYFYKHHELSVRMGFFWAAMSVADMTSAVLACGLLHMRGIQGQPGWRWMFLVEGLLTFVVGVLAFLLMPAGPCETASWFRGKNGWFTKREEKIIVNRVLRDDPSKGDMHNREPITLRLLWRSLKDYDLWPIYVLGLLFEVPMAPPSQYLTLSLKDLGFGIFQSNLLTIPYTIFHVITMLGITYLAEALNSLTYVALIGQLWALPFLIYLNVTDTLSVNRWVLYTVITLLLSYPNAHPIQVGWNSRNSNTVRSRTISAACYNMFVQASGIISSNIYRADDAPLYKRGNRHLLGILFLNIGLYVFVKAYYVLRNKQRDAIWNAMTAEERLHYLSTTTDQGNKRLDFRFKH